MEIKRYFNEFEGCYDYSFVRRGKSLDVIFARNLDLYMRLNTKDPIPSFKKKTISFDFTKENKKRQRDKSFLPKALFFR